MPQIINTNIASLNAQRNLDKAQSGNDTALQRLSSGLRINSSKDDAAGLSISTRFEAQISGTDVAIRNAGDGISLSQTAEGALDSITTNLQRVRELAVQSANGTNADVDRDALNAEAQQLLDEIQNTADNANYNGINLLDGSFATSLQVGANAGDTLDVNIGAVTTDTLGVADTAGLSAVGSDNAISNGDLFINGIAIGSSSKDDDTASTDNAAASAIAKVAAINKSTEETGVQATVNENTVSGSSQSAAAAADAGTLVINGVSVEISIAANDTAATRSGITQAINSISGSTGITAVDTGEDANGIILTAADGRNVTLSADLTNDFANYAAGDEANFARDTGLALGGDSGLGTPTVQTYEGGFTLSTTSGTSEIVISGGDGTGTGDLSNAGLTAGTYGSSSAALVSDSVAIGDSTNSVTGGTAANDNATVKTGTVATFSVAFDDTSNTAVANAAADTLADFAATVNGSVANTGVFAYEQLDVVIDVASSGISTLTDITFGNGAVGLGNALVAGSSARDLVSAINATDYTGSNFDITASYDADNDDILLNIRSADTAAAAFKIAAVGGAIEVESVNGDTGAQSTIAAAGNDVFTGQLAFEQLATGSSTVSVTDTGGTNLVDGNSQTVGLTQDSVLQSGDLIIEGVAIGAANAADDTATATLGSGGDLITSVDTRANGIAIAAAINKNSTETGVTAEVQATTLVGGSGGTGSALEYAKTRADIGDSGTVYINGVEIGTTTLVDDGSGAVDFDKARADTLAAINAKSGQTGVVAEDNGVSLTLTAADGRAISVAVDTNAAANDAAALGAGDSISALFGLDTEVDGIGGGDFTTLQAGLAVYADAEAVEANLYETTYSTVKLSAAGSFTVESGANGASQLSALGLTAGTFGGSESGQFLKDVDISTVEGANEALSAIDNALSQVASERANLGATQNRLDSTVSNLAITKENLSAANSRIKDADFAAETAELSRTQVLIQAGISVLAQANARPQQVLSLLG
ncbi:flagellin [Litoribacillus peritrichatus]|uniref:Flagellin n=1 Tax=Litoribacillus peritrichatus TaxID=718191 RepID=A0ABP7M647_9GAMM